MENPGEVYVVLEMWRPLVKSDVVLEVWRPRVKFTLYSWCADPW